MSFSIRNIALFAAVAAILLIIAAIQSASVALTILNLCLVSAVMSLGLNMQWGYAGLPNLGVMGFAALGGLAVVVVSAAGVPAAVTAGGAGLIASLVVTVLVVVAVLGAVRLSSLSRRIKSAVIVVLIVLGYALLEHFFVPAKEAIEAIDPSAKGYLGGLGLPVLLSWPVGAVLAAAAAWLVGKIALGLRGDYLAIASLGISEIVVAILKNEDWLSRGVKNVVGLPRPLPDELEVAQTPWLQTLSNYLGLLPQDGASLAVKLGYAGLFTVVLGVLLWLSERALHSPWGRMIYAVRDNEVAASAMGKNVENLHLSVFMLGAAVIGLAGAMLVTLDGQFTPGSYQPLRFTFLIWVMVIVGGAGTNWGAVLGALIIWTCWIEADPIGTWLLQNTVGWLSDGNPVREQLIRNASQMRLIVMGVILLATLRFKPGGLIPERR
ncbi:MULTISPECIES: branched-chain amino acid ABC transporter permease [unclassified Bradyrhizobium]|uniref:branched-chain amino acid ABC transporter permease n=1 Tax=unclassified Bradyrhizobium TaxID=2631580 RepID=UPI002915E485|nr:MULTISPECIES: branched-chain amino acid ABC transporter permease [unclassified Bradyrhizobium]